MEFGKRHGTTDTIDFCQRQIVTDLLLGLYHATNSDLIATEDRFLKFSNNLANYTWRAYFLFLFFFKLFFVTSYSGQINDDDDDEN